MSMAASTESLGEEIKVLERTLTLGNKLHKLKQDESSLSKKVKGLESKLKSARNIDLATCQKKLASLQEVSDTFGDDDDDAEVLEVTKLLIPKYIKYISLKKSVPDLQAKRQDLLAQLKVVREELALAEKVDVQSAQRWLDAHRALLNTYQEPTPKNLDVNEDSKKRALQAALAAENRRVKCAQGRIKALRLSLDALMGAEGAGASFLVRNGDDDDDEPYDDGDGDGDGDGTQSKHDEQDFREASSVNHGGDAGEANNGPWNGPNHQQYGDADNEKNDKARQYWRRYTVDGDSVFLAKQKLKAAAYGYKNDWDTLFAAIDHDGSGSLDQEEFRLGLRTRARIPQRQLSDQEVRKLFAAIDYSHDGSIEAREFSDFMSLTAKDYDEEDAAIAAAVAEAANDSHIIATLKKFYELEQPDKLAIGLHAINAHAGREDELIHKLVDRYGDNARFFFREFLPATDDLPATKHSPKPTTDNTENTENLSFEAVDLNGDGVIDATEFSAMMEKQQQQHTQESPRVVDIVENCVRELSEKLAACEAHLAKIRTLTEDDVDYLMSEMNAALEPAFAVLPQDHEVMLQCFEFVSRVDDLFSGGKGGMEDATNSVDIEPLSLGQEIQPLDSPADNSVDATPVAAAAADPALSTSEAVLARASQVSPKARGLARAANVLGDKLHEQRSSMKDEGSKSLEEAIDDAVSSVSESEEDSEDDARQLAEMERAYKEEHGESPKSHVGFDDGPAADTPPPPPRNPKPFSRGEVTIGDEQASEEDETDGSVTDENDDEDGDDEDGEDEDGDNEDGDDADDGNDDTTDAAQTDPSGDEEEAASEGEDVSAQVDATPDEPNELVQSLVEEAAAEASAEEADEDAEYDSWDPFKAEQLSPKSQLTRAQKQKARKRARKKRKKKK